MTEEALSIDGRALAKIRSREARVGIVGLGYVGLPLARAVSLRGYRVLGFDIDPEKVAAIAAGESYIRQITPEDLGKMSGVGFQATADFTRMGEVDIIIICVPTPLGPHREPDLTFLVKSAEAIASNLYSGQLVILESTSFPGTTREVVRPILMRSGLKIGYDVFLAYSPEREDPGNPKYSLSNISKIVGADDRISLDLAVAFYSRIVKEVHTVSSTDAAEAVKIVENVFRAVNIALANEFKMVFTRMGVNVWEVIDAAETKPFGYMPFYPGPGLGGHCIPIDPFYLNWRAKEFGVSSRLIELAGEINTAMPNYVVERLAEALDVRFSRGLNGSYILILGVAYKKNVEDIRESPALAIMDLLERRGVVVSYHDPFVPEIPSTRDHLSLSGRKSVPLTDEMLITYDAVVVITDHDDVDWLTVAEHSKLVVDTRGVMPTLTRGNVVLA